MYFHVFYCAVGKSLNREKKRNKIKNSFVLRETTKIDPMRITFFSEKVHRLFRGLAHFQPTKRKKGFRLAAVV